MSLDDRKDLPPINSPNFLERVREVLSVYLGNRGDALNRGVTLRDLVDSGMATLDARFAGGGKSITPLLPVTPPTYEADLSPPPAPTGFAASAAISNILVECDAQTYTQGHGHSKSRLYGATWVSGDLPVYANAVLLSEFQGTVASYATNPATTWRLWLTWVSVDGVESITPAGGTNGIAVSTGQDVGLLLEALTGEITQSQLYADLGARINLIDGTGVGSVAARIQTEAITRSNADAAEAAQRTTLAATVGVNTAAISTETSTRASQTGDLFAQYTVKVDVNGYVSGFGLASTLKNATPSSEFAVRADRFYIASPSGPGIAPITPFVVTTSASTVNGVAVPAGVYMDAAFIKNGTITNAKIGDAAIDDAKITTLSATKFKAGTIAVGEYIQGSGYVAGSAGWRINGNGTAEFSGVVVRGEVHATSGTFTGTLTGSTIEGGTINGTTINGATVNSGNVFIWGANGADSGWGCVRSNYSESTGKWLDLNDGWVLAQCAVDGSSFLDFKTGNCRLHMQNLLSANGDSGAFAAIDWPGLIARSDGYVNIGNGKFLLGTDGALSVDNVTIKRRIVVETGIGDPPNLVFGSYDVTQEYGAGTVSYPVGTVFKGDVTLLVTTGTTDAATQSATANQPYYVAANFTGPFRQWSGGASTFRAYIVGKPSVSRAYSNTGAWAEDFSIQITFSYAVVLLSGAFTQFQLPTFAWTLYKI